MKTVDIKGKPYVEVNERIKFFRENYPTGSIITEIVSIDNGVCVMKSNIYIDNELRAVGHAYEKEGSTFINKTSYIENCETSAVGRALGIMGIGIDTSIASSNEVENAIANQNKKGTPNKSVEPPKENKTKITTEMLVNEATSKGYDVEYLKAKYIKDTGKKVSDVKFMPLEWKQKYYNQLLKVEFNPRKG